MTTIEPLLVARAELIRQRTVFDRRIITLARPTPGIVMSSLQTSSQGATKGSGRP
jgi:hypothetical protein